MEGPPPAMQPEKVAYIVGDKDGLTFGRIPELIGVRSPLRIQIGVFDVIDIAAVGVVQAKPLLCVTATSRTPLP